MARESAFDAPMALEVPRISPRTAPPAAPELASLSSMLSVTFTREKKVQDPVSREPNDPLCADACAPNFQTASQ